MSLARWSRWCAGLGGVVWLILFATRHQGSYVRAIELLLSLAMLVLTPLALALSATPNRSGRHPRIYVAAVRIQPIAAALAIMSFSISQGVAAALLTIPWLFFTVLVALFGLLRFLPRGLVAIDEVLIDSGLVYLPIGGFWLTLHRLGVTPLGFVEPIVILTAVHFHYAAFIIPILAGLSVRSLLKGRPPSLGLLRIIGLGIMLGPTLIAVGITVSPLIEVFAGLMLAASLVLLSVVTLAYIIPTTHHITGRVLLSIFAVSLLTAMVLAGAYAVGEFEEKLTVSIPGMVQLHGWLNAVGVGVCGLIAWTILRLPSRLPAPGIPFSRIFSRGRVGCDFLHRVRVVDHGKDIPSGLVDDLDDYQGLAFSPDKIDSAIRAFYERTGDYALLVRPQWRGVFRPTARIYKSLSSWVEQMNFPLSQESREDLIHSILLPICDGLDGRTNVRAWVRTYANTDKAMYVALYATHRMGTQTYMNIAFPLPGGNLTSVLRMEHIEVDGDPCGVLLTTSPRHRDVGDEGVYFANRILPIRLPMNETIRVWPASVRGVPIPYSIESGAPATIVARHDMWLCGLKFLTLEYTIFRK